MSLTHEPQVKKVRRMTGVGAAEYVLDATTYWTDAQIDELLVEYQVVDPEDPEETIPDVLTVAAEVLEGWAAYLVRAYDVTMDGQSLRRSQMADKLQARAEALRDQAGGPGAADGVYSVELEAPL